MNDKPIKVGRFLAIFYNILKLRYIFAAMVEYRVENNLYTTLMGALYKSFEHFFVAEMFVDFIVVAYIILMVGGRLKNRREIERIYTERL